MTDRRSIAILGIFVADTSFRTPRLPAWGETILGAGFALGPGGKGSNQAVAVARLGGDARMITRLGTDAFGDMATTLWHEAGVTPVVTRSEDLPTGAACILIDAETGENAIIVTPGVAGTLSAADAEGAADTIRGAAVFMTQLEQPLDAARRGLEIAREAGVVTVLNPAPAADLPDALLALCDYVTPNESEAEMLSGVAVRDTDTAREAAEVLLGRGARAVVITLGAGGALYHDGEATMVVPAFDPGKVVETTGAGDAFNGAFATGLAEGMAPVEAVRFGCATAALSVGRAGAAAAMPGRDEVETFLNA